MNSLIITILVSLFVISCAPRENNKVESKPPIPEKVIGHEHRDTEQQKADSTSGILAPGSCAYDNDVSSLGIGLVMASAKFVIFDDSMLTRPFGSFDMYSENTGRLCSKFFKPDYGIMHFICLDSTENAYEILTDYSTIKYLQKNTGHAFVTWNDYILQSHGIRRHDSSQQPLKSKPLDKSESLLIPSGFEMFCPIEIQGDWVKVTYDCFYNQKDNPHEGRACYEFIHECESPLIGWIKWRDNKEILIDIFLMA